MLRGFPVICTVETSISKNSLRCRDGYAKKHSKKLSVDGAMLTRQGWHKARS